MWVRDDLRSLKIVLFESLDSDTVSCLPCIVAMAVSLAILNIFSVK